MTTEQKKALEAIMTKPENIKPLSKEQQAILDALMNQ
jgi:hypothetical protein